MVFRKAELIESEIRNQTALSMSTSLDELLNAEFKEAFDEFDKVNNVALKVEN